jgi:hypothetical protein
MPPGNLRHFWERRRSTVKSGATSTAAMMTRRQVTLACAAALTGLAAERGAPARIRFCRVPEGGWQPQVAVDDSGNVHLIYYKGDPGHGDLFYVQSTDGGMTFSRALRVNSQPGSAIAAGSIRGAQLALGKAGRIHAAWNGSMEAKPVGPLNPDSGKPGAPMLYARLDIAGNTFEPQRNLMRHSFGLDGGGSVTADRSGNVYVAWHGIGDLEALGGKKGEGRRRVWVTASEDEGRSFADEKKAWPEETGACGCCDMKIFADRRSNVWALYRSATELVHRDIYLLKSSDQGKSFEGRLVQKWEINACPMSSMDIAENANIVVGAWETAGQVYWARLNVDGGGAVRLISAPGVAKGRKHPRVAINQNGDVLLVWTEGTGWQKGGSLAYQVYGRDGRPTTETARLPGIPAWSFAAAAPGANGGFSIIY